jgi:hypothetical protein
MGYEAIFQDGVLGASGVAVTSLTLNFTPSFPDSIGRHLFICIASWDQLATDAVVASVTVGGVAATLVRAANANVCSAIYRFKQPPKSTFAVVVNFNPSSLINCRVFVYEYEYVEPGTPVGVTDGATGTGTADTRVLNPIAGGVASLLLEHLAINCGTATTAGTIAAPFSTDDNVLVGTSPNRTRGMAGNAQLQTGPSVNAAISIAVSKPWAHVAVELMAERQFPLQSLVGMGV